MAQEAMVRTYRAWERIRDREHPFAYARTVLLNHRRSVARRAKVALSRTHTTSGEVPELNTERVALWQALAKLSGPQREAIVLRYYEDLTEAETAAVMRCPVGTVKSHVRRGLGRLRIGLSDEAGQNIERKESI